MTNFLFFGNFGIDFLFHLFFLYRYARTLEEGSFRRRTSDFFFMLLFGALFLIGVTVLFAPPIHFLGSSLTFMLVYVWSKRNRDVQMRFMQMFNFTAPTCPGCCLRSPCCCTTMRLLILWALALVTSTSVSYTHLTLPTKA